MINLLFKEEYILLKELKKRPLDRYQLEFVECQNAHLVLTNLHKLKLTTKTKVTNKVILVSTDGQGNTSETIEDETTTKHTINLCGSWVLFLYEKGVITHTQREQISLDDYLKIQDTKLKRCRTQN